MKPNDKVIIIKDVFAKEYEKTDAVVTYTSSEFIYVDRHDGSNWCYHKDSLTSPKDYYYNEDSLSLDTHGSTPSPIPSDYPCAHPDMYLNVISKSMKFLYCPTCSFSADVIDSSEEK